MVYCILYCIYSSAIFLGPLQGTSLGLKATTGSYKASILSGQVTLAVFKWQLIALQYETGTHIKY
jgi:hypothetical protein